MFQFPSFPTHSYVFTVRYLILHQVCSHIRKSPDRGLFTAPRGLSQLVTSFIGSWCQGIHLTLFFAWTSLENLSILLLGSRSILNCLSFVNKYLLGFLFALKKLPFSLLLNLHLSVKLYFTHFFGKTYLISFKLIKSVLFYLFVLLFNILYSVFNEHI